MAENTRGLKAIRAWASTWIAERWLELLIGFFAGGGMIYVATITEWMKPLGPMGWALAGFIPMLIVIPLYALYWWTRGRRDVMDFTKRIAEKSGVSPLEPVFERKRINIADFYNPYYVPYKSKRFLNCQIWGPANVVLINSHLVGGEFKHCQFVILKKDSTPLFGVVLLDHAVITDCEISNITLLMNRKNYEQVVRDNPGLDVHVHVINEEFNKP
jgi:hypothetical protein